MTIDRSQGLQHQLQNQRMKRREKKESYSKDQSGVGDNQRWWKLDMLKGSIGERMRSDLANRQENRRRIEGDVLIEIEVNHQCRSKQLHYLSELFSDLIDHLSLIEPISIALNRLPREVAAIRKQI